LAIQPFWASQLWSIGVEEWYYLVWPWILRKCNAQNLLKIVALSLCGVLGVKLSLWFIDVFLDAPFLDLIRSFFYWFRVEAILVGALASVLWYQKNKLIQFIIGNYARYLTIALIMIILFTKSIGPIFSIIDATVFGVLVIQVVEKPWFVLENKIVKYLGKISYGLYMYHDLAIIISIQAITYLLPDLSPGIYSACLYLFTLILSFIAAYLSFHYFEEPLRLRWNKSLKN
jgi:peptidoglycan/LPS O-acetylase OafA/YrhL